MPDCCAYPLYVKGKGFISTCRNPLHYGKPIAQVAVMKIDAARAERTRRKNGLK